MKKPLIVATGFCVFALMVALGLAWMDQEPTIAGEPVSHWIRELGQGPYPRGVIATEHLTSAGSVVVGHLIEALEEQSEFRIRSRQIYWTIWSNTPNLIRRWMPSPNEFQVPTRKTLLSVLSKVAPGNPDVVDLLIVELGNPSRSIRFEAVSALRRMTTNVSSKVVPALIDTLTNDSAHNIRGRAAYSLSEIGEPAKAAVPALIEAMIADDSEVELRWTAALAIGNLGEENESTMAAIESQLSDPAPKPRMHAAWAHFKLTGSTAPAVDILISILEDTNGEYRHSAASILSEIGPVAKSALPTLRKTTLDPDLGVSLFSAYALWTVGGDTDVSLPALRNVLRNGTVYYKMRVTEFLGNMGNVASSSVPDLISATTDEVVTVRRRAIVALGKIGATSTSAVPALIEIERNDPVPSVSDAARESLHLIRSGTSGSTEE